VTTNLEKKTAEDWVPVALPIPDHWAYVDFDEAFDSVSLSNIKTPESQYKRAGAFPVVDQGQKLISGYTDSEDNLINKVGSVIVFGDHTRCFKLIDFPFAPGADGTKVLTPKHYLLPSFAYYGCLTLQLPNRGYSRHYSFLRKSMFPVAPVGEQKRIVEKIDQLFAELEKGVESLTIAQNQLTVYRQAILKHAFSSTNSLGLSNSQPSWPERRLGDMISF
jgi:type I restriction enzyme S subunit